jgi:hypothetical protein
MGVSTNIDEVELFGQMLLSVLCSTVAVTMELNAPSVLHHPLPLF